MHVKKSTILFSVLFIVSFVFTSNIFGEPVSRNVNDASKNSNTHTRKDPSSQENFSVTVKSKITEQIELLRQKRAEFFAQQNFTKQLSSEEIFSIIEYVRELKLAARKVFADKFIQVKGILSANGRRLRSYVFTPEEQLHADQILVTEHGLISRPTIYKAHAAMAWAAGGFTASAAVPIVAAARSAVNGSGDSVPAGNFAPADNSAPKENSEPKENSKPTNSAAAAASKKHSEPIKGTGKVPEVKKNCKKTGGSKSVHGSIPLSTSKSVNGSPHIINTNSSKSAAQVPLNRAQASVPSKTASQNKVQFNPERAAAENKDKFDRDNVAYQADGPPVCSPLNNVKPQVVKDFEAQKIHNQEKQDRVINAAASIVVSRLQRYDQQQKQYRRAKTIAEWSQAKEDDIQRRMRAESKSRYQIEEEDRLFVKKCEELRIEERKKQEEVNKNKSKASRQQPESDACRTSNSGPGNGPDKEPDDDQEKVNKEKRIKQDADKRARHNRFGNFYRDPQTKLWWSKDLDQHGGSIYKVFKEGAKGLEWLFDANAQGQRIFGKHKGSTGKFIPYKELIFYS